MKRKLNRLSRQYVVALRKHVKQAPGGSLQAARRLGCEGVDLGLETLDVARMHAKALATLDGAGRDGVIKKAEIFFAEAITPIEKGHGAALKAKAHLNQVHERLDQRTVDLAATNRSLKRSIARRKSAEKALRKSGRDARKLLEESRRLQKHLQRLTHRILSAHEDKRKRISRNLQNEIAQTLLGINVRLVALRKEAVAEALQKEIASTRGLVDKSMKSIKGFAREFTNDHAR
jgi:signal transduction histidine kinase